MSKRYSHKIVDGKKGVKIENDKYSTSILFMSNGFQWSGSPIDKELAKMAIEALKAYIDSDIKGI